VSCGTSRLSYAPGDDIALHVSTTSARYSVKIARVGAKREPVWKKDEVAGANHPIPDNVSTHGCGWPVAVSIRVPDEWPSGYYSVTLKATAADGKPVQQEAFFVVRSAHPGKRARILLQLTTNTYNAYNNWGGPCLYESGATSSARNTRSSVTNATAVNSR